MAEKEKIDFCTTCRKEAGYTLQKRDSLNEKVNSTF